MHKAKKGRSGELGLALGGVRLPALIGLGPLISRQVSSKWVSGLLRNSSNFGWFWSADAGWVSAQLGKIQDLKFNDDCRRDGSIFGA
jgi:hypothetical protein